MFTISPLTTPYPQKDNEIIRFPAEDGSTAGTFDMPFYFGSVKINGLNYRLSPNQFNFVQAMRSVLLNNDIKKHISPELNVTFDVITNGITASGMKYFPEINCVTIKHLQTIIVVRMKKNGDDNNARIFMEKTKSKLRSSGINFKTDGYH